MKYLRISDVCWEIALWISFLAILCIFEFGASVNVDFIDPEVPFAEAWASVVWKWSIPGAVSGDFGLCLATSFIGLMLHSSFRNWKIRVVVMAIGFMAPVFSIGVVMLWVAVVSPVMVYSVLAGRADGEFYCEGMLMLAAIGLWMIQCLVSGAVDFVRRPRKPVVVEGFNEAASPNPESAGPIKRLPKLPSLDPRNETPLH